MTRILVSDAMALIVSVKRSRRNACNASGTLRVEETKKVRDMLCELNQNEILREVRASVEKWATVSEPIQSFAKGRQTSPGKLKRSCITVQVQPKEKQSHEDAKKQSVEKVDVGKNRVGHKSEDCKGEIMCRKCAEAKCAVCQRTKNPDLDVKHEAYSQACPVLKRLLEEERERPPGSGFIDFTAVNFKVYGITSDWYLSNDETVSDHKHISFEICSDNNTEQRQTREFCTRLSAKNPWGLAYSIVRPKRGNTGASIILKRGRDEYTQDTRKTAELLLETFFPDDDANADDEGHVADAAIPNDRDNVRN
ncbi:hypothetical protein Trydic_g6522 [Trypoxylus dichotomus]